MIEIRYKHRVFVLFENSLGCWLRQKDKAFDRKFIRRIALVAASFYAHLIGGWVFECDEYIAVFDDATLKENLYSGGQSIPLPLVMSSWAKNAWVLFLDKYGRY